MTPSGLIRLMRPLGATSASYYSTAACRWRRFPIARKRSVSSRPSRACTTTWAMFYAHSSVTPRRGASYLEAIRLAPDLAKAHAHLGLTLMREGQQDEALTHLKRARELDPADPTIAEFLGDLFVECEQFAEAVTHYRRAIDLAPAIGRRSIFRSVGHSRKMVVSMRPESITRLPTGSRPKWQWFSHTSGAFTKKKETWRRRIPLTDEAMRLQPGFSLPFARLATLLRGKLPDAEVAAIEAHLAEPDQLKEPRGRLLFGLAHVLDARGEYAPPPAPSTRQML